VAGISYRDVHGIADELGVDVQTVRRWIQSGKLRAFKPGKEYRVREADLEEFLAAREVRPKAESSSLELSQFNGADDELRADWSNAVEEAQRLRETAGTQMWNALSEWRASKKRGESYDARRKYLDEMGNLLQEAYGAYTALGWAYVQASITQGGSEASVPSYLGEESEKANDFYVELFGMVREAKLTISRDPDAGAARRAEKPQPEVRPHAVEEPAA
jgi:excisionase family DNA binding protein